MKWRNRTSHLSDEIARLAGLDAYELLHVKKDATLGEIRAAYLKIVKVYHPDKSDPFLRKHNEQVTKIINDAYEQLVTKQEACR